MKKGSEQVSITYTTNENTVNFNYDVKKLNEMAI